MTDHTLDEEGLFGEVSQVEHKVIEQEKKDPLQEIDDDQRIRIAQIDPVQQKNVKSNALEFDIKLGWMPRSQITGPIPLAYAHPDLDDLIEANIGPMIYLGYRPTNTFDVHKQFYGEGKNYPFNQFHLCKSQFLERFFKKYYSEYDFYSKRQHGMQTEDSPLIFDSFFEGGNLDAVYFTQGEYRLMLRVDTNTKGHCNYYHFKVKNKVPGRYNFRIMNMSKGKSLYERGKKPYIKTKNNSVWKQGGDKVRYGISPLFQQYQLQKKFYSLKFEYEFTQANDEVEFCYGIPFLYSDLLKFLEGYRSNPHFYLNKLCHSLSGLEIPLVTITETDKQANQEQNKQKNVVMIIGRAHPGETHGSHIINGLIKYLLSDSSIAKIFRKAMIIKIVPMINPDGVVAGNTRTSFTGKDLNRVYSHKTDFVFPQIIGIRDFTLKLKSKYGKRFLFLIDVHGHSTRKNSFFFGPQYPVFDEEYTKCRMLARIFSSKTQIFRYYSCRFRLSTHKQKTCRGFFNTNNIVRAYTHETSMHGFFDFEKRYDTVFNKLLLEDLGEKMLLSIYDYVAITIKKKEIPVPEPVNKKKAKKKVQEQEYEEDSDEMASDRADSQDSSEDFGLNHLRVFFNRINENREYFYEELCFLNGFTKPQPRKIVKMTAKDYSDDESSAQQKKTIQTPITSFTPNFQSQKLQETKKKSKIWIPKLEAAQKKINFQEYDKVSSVIFGNTMSLLPKTKEYETEKPKPVPEQRVTKYSFVNFSPLTEIGVTKTRFTQTKISKSPKFTEKKEKSPKTIHGSIEMPKLLLDNEALQKLVTSKKTLDILGQTNQRFLSQSQPKQQTKSMQGTSLKFLPRKKSIKSIKYGQDYVEKKIAKTIKQDTLTKKLPSLKKLNKY